MLIFLKGLIKPNFILVLISLLVHIYCPNITEIYKQYFSDYKEAESAQDTNTENLFTKSNLAQFNGDNEDKPIYLSILGTVHDVTTGKKYYGKGCAYNFFAGKDGSVAFITGEFEEYTEDSDDDVLKFEASDLQSLYNWKQFYDKEYIYKGKLIGRFYDERGAKTGYLKRVDQVIGIAEMKRQELPSASGKLTSISKKYFKSPKTSYHCLCGKENDFLYPENSHYIIHCDLEWPESLDAKALCLYQNSMMEVGDLKFTEVYKPSYKCYCKKVDSNSRRYKTCVFDFDMCFYKKE